MIKQLLQIPNLLSLSRVFLTPVIGYYLARGDNQSTMICLVLIIVAGLTDGLDGYLARKLNQISDLGKVLDPLADKLFSGVLVVLLIFYRDFPIWMAAVIIGRDLFILAAGLILLRGQKIVVSSNLIGKYSFAAIALLLVSYVLRFPFGIYLCSIIVIILVTASTFSYTSIYLKILKGKPVIQFQDKPIYKGLRILFIFSFLTLFIYELYTFVITL